MIQISNLNLNFGSENIFTDFSLHIDKGEKIAISGESGKGKSTLLNILSGFITSYTGNITIDKININSNTINEIRKLTAWLPQDISLNVETVEEMFLAPFNFSLNKSKHPNEEQISETFTNLCLSDKLLAKKVKEISGGQKQRILIATCLLLNKPILLIDEPTSALDDKIKKKVTDYIIGQQNLTVVAVTHDNYWINKSDKNIILR